MFFILAAMVLYSLVIIVIAKASRSGDASFVTAVVNAISAIVPLVVIAPAISQKYLNDNKPSIVWSIFSGILITGFSLALAKAYQTDKIAIITPIVFGGAIAISTVLAYFIYNEKISKLEFAGLALVIAGISLVVVSKLNN